MSLPPEDKQIHEQEAAAAATSAGFICREKAPPDNVCFYFARQELHIKTDGWFIPAGVT